MPHKRDKTDSLSFILEEHVDLFTYEYICIKIYSSLKVITFVQKHVRPR